MDSGCEEDDAGFGWGGGGGVGGGGVGGWGAEGCDLGYVHGWCGLVGRLDWMVLDLDEVMKDERLAVVLSKRRSMRFVGDL